MGKEHKPEWKLKYSTSLTDVKVLKCVNCGKELDYEYFKKAIQEPVNSIFYRQLKNTFLDDKYTSVLLDK